jgi:hypothetical protein
MKAFARRSIRRIACAVLPLAALHACVDTSPIDYHEPRPADAGSDGAASGVDPALVAQCRACVTKGACSAAYAECGATPACEAFTGCLLDVYCMNFKLGDLSTLPQCLYTCGAKVGLTSASDPAVRPYIPVIICAEDPTTCGSVCAPRGDR